MEFNAAADIGTFSLLSLVVLTYRIILGHFFCRYGYMVLATWGGIGLAIVTVRILRDNLGLISASEASQYAAISYMVGTYILATLIMAERKFHRIVGKHHRGGMV